MLSAWMRRLLEDWHTIGDLIDQARDQERAVTPAAITVIHYGDQGEMRHPDDTTHPGW